MLRVKQGAIIFCVFGMTQPGTEPRSPGPLANTLTIMPISGYFWKGQTVRNQRTTLISEENTPDTILGELILNNSYIISKYEFIILDLSKVQKFINKVIWGGSFIFFYFLSLQHFCFFLFFYVQVITSLSHLCLRKISRPNNPTIFSVVTHG